MAQEAEGSSSRLIAYFIVARKDCRAGGLSFCCGAKMDLVYLSSAKASLALWTLLFAERFNRAAGVHTNVGRN
jgi:hypothetical protein